MSFFKRYKEKIKKCCNASISILLCIIITPVISIAGMLVEFSRYQSTINLLNEIMDASTLSVLADYDTYIKDRFGLYAVSQESDISDAYVSYFDDNTALLGGLISITDTATASGDLPLSNVEIIKQQLMDYSESTELVEFVMNELKLQELLSLLDSLEGLDDIAGAANDIADAATKIKQVVEAAEALKTAITEAVDAINNFKTTAENFIKSITALFEKINNDNFEIDPENEFESYIDFVESYLDSIENITDSYDNLTGQFDTVIQKIEAIGSKITALENAITAAETALGLTESSPDSSSDSTDLDDAVEDGIKESGDALEAVLNEIKGAINEARKATLTGAKDAAQSAFDAFKEEIRKYIYDELKLGLLIDSVGRDGEGNLTITDTGKANIDEILTLIGEIFTDGADPDTVIQGIINTYKPDFSGVSIDSLAGVLESAIQAGKDALAESANAAAQNVLIKLVNTIKGMFNLDVIYNDDMNAYVSRDIFDNSDNPYQAFLTAVNNACDAASEFVDAIKNLEFFKALEKIAELFKAMADAISAVVSLVDELIEKIGDTIDLFTDGGAGLYEFLLIVAYMTHNLPDRTCGDGYDDIQIDIGGGEYAQYLNLAGETTSGFAFTDIPNAPTVSSDRSMGGIMALAETITGTGSDDMFVGAELEYILAGTNSEILNQGITFLDIYFIRLLLNIPVVLLDGEVATMAGAANIACWVVYLLVIIGEPFLDTVLIVNTPRDKECAVPVVKLDGVYLSPSGIAGYCTDLAEVVADGALEDLLKEEIEGMSTGSGSGGKATKDDFGGIDWNAILSMDYQMYVMLSLMITVSRQEILERFTKLVELEARAYYDDNGITFDMDSAYAAVQSECSIKLESFLSFIDFVDDSVLQKKFTRTRGY